MATRSRCIVTWRCSGPCAVCGVLIRSTRAEPGAHLPGDPDGPATLPTCGACCPQCAKGQGVANNSVSRLFSTAWQSVKNTAVSIH